MDFVPSHKNIKVPASQKLFNIVTFSSDIFSCAIDLIDEKICPLYSEMVLCLCTATFTVESLYIFVVSNTVF